MSRLLIIGGSHAGISAGLRAQELDDSAEVTLVVADAYPFEGARDQVSAGGSSYPKEFVVDYVRGYGPLIGRNWSHNHRL